MPKISVGTYSMRVRQLRADDWLVLDGFDERHDVRAAIHAYLRNLENADHDTEAQRVLRVTRLEDDARSVWGTVEVGDYGYAADLMNIETLQQTYNRTPQEAELVPLFFLMDCPPGVRQGISILQRLGRLGVKTVLTSYLQRRFKEEFPNYRLKFHTQVPQEVLNYLMNGSLKRIQLLRYRVPNDLADTVRLGQFPEDEAHLRISINANRGKELPLPDWVGRVLRGEAHFNEVVSPDYDTARITVRFRGVERTVDVGRPDRIAPYIDCGDEVEVTDEGHPEFEGMLEYSRELVGDLRDQMGQ